MSARTNLVINDRAATPVAHTYTPDGDDQNGVHIYSEKTSIPAGNPRFSISLVRKNGKYKATIKLSVPITATQTINGVSSPAILRTSYLEFSTSFDEYSTTQERADAVGLLVNSLAASQTQINDLLVNVSDIY